MLEETKPDELLVGLNIRDRSCFDMYRIHLSTGACQLDTVNPGDVLGWYTDSNFVIRAAYASDPVDGGRMLRSVMQSSFPDISGVLAC
jgi:hypothetical protein